MRRRGDSTSGVHLGGITGPRITVKAEIPGASSCSSSREQKGELRNQTNKEGRESQSSFLIVRKLAFHAWMVSQFSVVLLGITPISLTLLMTHHIKSLLT